MTTIKYNQEEPLAYSELIYFYRSPLLADREGIFFFYRGEKTKNAY